MTNAVLIIDDDSDVLDALRVLLEDEFDVVTESNTKRISTISIRDFDAVLLDMNFSAGINTGNEGLFWLREILKHDPGVPVIMMTAYGNINLAVEAIKHGAKDFILKPWENDKLLATIKSNKRKKVGVASIEVMPFQNWRSPAMKNLHEQIRKVADTDASVLLLGENGSGKEVVAKEIHHLSKRAKSKFASVDLSVLTPTLFESELFGYKKGAFTDAKEDRSGRFEDASGGTLFLDEIGNLPMALQAKLLTVLQQRQVVPVGSNKPVSIDVRLVSATNANLDLAIATGLFRQDLLYRINTITLTVPPLRQREEDIMPLAEYFLSSMTMRYQKALTYSDSARQALLAHNWPGNVRELQHTIEKAVILSEGNQITERDLQLSISSSAEYRGGRRLDDVEKEALKAALKEHRGNIVHAAKSLGITRQTLYNKMKKYGL
ncbi:MAG TPA: sigma-54 dependent transcriptional regulator [Chryseosolibacter sp.]|nr:sigma-54 dependent transcriptional regulator [Chryseosolibacter sp.]